MNSCFDQYDFVVSARDAQRQTVHLSLDLHPGQIRIVEHLVRGALFPFRDCADVVRWCTCFGLHTLLGRVPHPLSLMEAKMDIFQDERFEAQKDCLSISVQKYLMVGNLEAARRAVTLSYDEYSRIQCEYWRERWLSTLKDPIEQLQKLSVRINIPKLP